MIKVESKVEIYEVAGKDTDNMNKGRPVLKVSGHWNRNTMVVLQVGEQETISVVASDLLAALQNATNRGA